MDQASKKLAAAKVLVEGRNFPFSYKLD